jgi:hypothetical protein
VALQINTFQFAVEDGVSLDSPTTGLVPERAWALSDLSDNEVGLCTAFKFRGVHVFQTCASFSSLEGVGKGA